MKEWLNGLHAGDCITVLNSLDHTSHAVDLVFADPPYNIGYSYDVYHDDKEDEAYLEWTHRWMSAASRVLKPTGSFWIAIGDEYAAEVKIIGDRLGLHLRSWVIWYYTFGVHCKYKFSRSHTHLFYFTKHHSKFTFNDGDIRVKSARQLVYSDARADRRGRMPDNTWILRPQDVHGGFEADHDTWYFPRVAGTFKERAGFHGCQLPEQLLGRVIRCCTNPGDVVLDPFAGSGSTLIVAKKLARQWVGYELSPEYVRHAKARLSAVRAGDPLEGSEDPLSSAPATPVGKGSRRSPTDERAIGEAFRRSADGYSSDRVIADPVLNAAFVDQCGILGVPGCPRDWNLTLMALRKQKRLTFYKATKTTTFSWEEMDPFLFASEMALRHMLDVGLPSLDHILCDPHAAARFDCLARSLAPGFSSLQYRWGALRLRKDARLWREYAETLGGETALPRSREIPLDPVYVSRLPQSRAVYLLAAADGELPAVYVGETHDLARRAQRVLAGKDSLDQLLVNSGRWRLELFELPDADECTRRGFQSLLIGRKKPLLNYMELAYKGRTALSVV